MAFNNNNNKKMQLTTSNEDSSSVLNLYYSMNMNNICRICMEKGQKLMPIFDPIKPPHFSILIMACAAVQVMEGDGLPPFICQKCISKLNIAFQFKNMCESSDAKLRQCLLQMAEFQCLEESTTISSGNENTDNLIYENDTKKSTFNIDTENNCLIGEIQVDLKHGTLQTLENVGLNDTTNNIQQVELTTDYNIIDSKTKEFNENNTDNLKTTTKKMKQHQCDTCGKIFRTKPGLVHHIRIHTGERPYVCHLCDKRFINGGHLHTHMRTHTGEKNHVCAACSKAFATAQQLTKHTIAIHTSERPYGCTYCQKRFASSSNLNTHIKIHTGEKNYHCDQCGKAFSTKGQLYQHMLVHTGEKAYLCEFCNKRFSQKAHLVRHSKIHKID